MDTHIPGAAAFCEDVGCKIVAATRSVDQTVLELTGCIQAMVEGREVHDLKLDVVMLEIESVAEALLKTTAARTAIAKTRMRLVRWPERLGLDDYGTGCPCTNPSVTPLRSVA